MTPLLLWLVVVLAVAAYGWCIYLGYLIIKTAWAIAPMHRDILELDRLLRLIAAQWHFQLPPPADTVNNGEAGQFIHWENFPIKAEMADVREVEKEAG